MRDARDSRAIIGTAALLFFALLSSFTPTPLYPLYAAKWGMSEQEVSLAFSAYAVGVLLVLFFFGGLSDRIGRLATLRTGLLVSVAAVVVLALAPHPLALGLGRLLQGLSNGLITGAGAALLMERHPGGLRSGSHLNTLTLACGVAVGPVLAGLISAHLPAPLVLPYVMVLAGLLVPAALLFRVRSDRPPEATARLARPVRVPRSLWKPFSVAALTLAGTNLCFSVVGAFGSEIAVATGWTSPAAAGLVVSLVLGVVAVTQVGGRALPADRAMVAGLAVAVVGWAGLTVGTGLGMALPVVLGAVVLGAGAGLGMLASVVFIGSIAPLGRRAEIYSAYLVCGFSTLASAPLVIAPIVARYSISTALATACAFAVLLTISATVALRASSVHPVRNTL